MVRVRNVFFITYLIINMSSVLAKPSPLSLRIERSNSHGIEQFSLVFKNNKVMVIVNSNFLNQSHDNYSLGLFTKQLDDKYLKIRNILQVDTIEQSNIHHLFKQSGFKEINKGSPHRLKLMLGKREILPSSPDYKRLYGIIHIANNDYAKWISIQSIQVFKLPDNRLQTIDRQGNKNILVCDKPFCNILGHGTIWMN